LILSCFNIEILISKIFPKFIPHKLHNASQQAVG
jgi:hypothetical protein